MSYNEIWPKFVQSDKIYIFDIWCGYKNLFSKKYSHILCLTKIILYDYESGYFLPASGFSIDIYPKILYNLFRSTPKLTEVLSHA